MDKVVLYASDDTIGIVAPLFARRTDVGQRFKEVARKDGLSAALEWRAAQFAE